MLAYFLEWQRYVRNYEMTLHEFAERPIDDKLASRVRARLWAWLVYCLTPGVRSWGELDAHWLPRIDEGTPTDRITGKAAPRRRVFYRYYRTGDDPGALKGLNGKRLVSVVHKEESMSPATDLFDSAFWALVGETEFPTEYVRPLHQALMVKLGLIRLTPTERILARRANLPSTDYENRKLRNVERAAKQVADIASLDAIALLACAFMLAKDALSFREAAVYLDAIRHALRAFAKKWNADEDVNRSLAGLVERRILRRTKEAIKPQELGFWVRKRSKSYDPEWGRTHLWGSACLDSQAQPESPIVPLDETLESFLKEFESNYGLLRSELLADMESLDDDDSPSMQGGDIQLRKSRSELIDGYLLSGLNSLEDSGAEVIAWLKVAGLSGGLAGRIYDLVNPNCGRKKRVLQQMDVLMSLAKRGA